MKPDLDNANVGMPEHSVFNGSYQIGDFRFLLYQIRKENIPTESADRRGAPCILYFAMGTRVSG